MDFDGKNRKTVLEKGVPYPFGIALYQERLYWTDWKTWFVHIFCIYNLKIIVFIFELFIKHINMFTVDKTILHKSQCKKMFYQTKPIKNFTYNLLY